MQIRLNENSVSDKIITNPDTQVDTSIMQGDGISENDKINDNETNINDEITPNDLEKLVDSDDINSINKLNESAKSVENHCVTITKNGNENKEEISVKSYIPDEDLIGLSENNLENLELKDTKINGNLVLNADENETDSNKSDNLKKDFKEENSTEIPTDLLLKEIDNLLDPNEEKISNLPLDDNLEPEFTLALDISDSETSAEVINELVNNVVANSVATADSASESVQNIVINDDESVTESAIVNSKSDASIECTPKPVIVTNPDESIETAPISVIDPLFKLDDSAEPAPEPVIDAVPNCEASAKTSTDQVIDAVPNADATAETSTELVTDAVPNPSPSAGTAPNPVIDAVLNPDASIEKTPESVMAPNLDASIEASPETMKNMAPSSDISIESLPDLVMDVVTDCESLSENTPELKDKVINLDASMEITPELVQVPDSKVENDLESSQDVIPKANISELAQNVVPDTNSSKSTIQENNKENLTDDAIKIETIDLSGELNLSDEAIDKIEDTITSSNNQSTTNILIKNDAMVLLADFPENIAEKPVENGQSSCATIDIDSDNESNEAPQPVQNEKPKPDDTPKFPPLDFTKVFKEYMGRLSRRDLEEFCIVKLVEAIKLRSNMAETDARVTAQGKKLDTLRQTIFSLSKQNKDLELVVKNLISEHKKRKNEVVEPVRLARSVGFQVGQSSFKMKPGKPIPQPNGPNRNPPVALNKQMPRLVHADSSRSPPVAIPLAVPIEGMVKKSTPNFQGQFNNSIRPPPKRQNATTPQTPKARPKPKTTEKRVNDTSIDLTDDEPPTKQMLLSIKTPTQISKPTINALAGNRLQLVGPSGSTIPVKIVQTGLNTLLKTGTDMVDNPNKKIAIPIKASSISSLRYIGHPAPLPDTPTWYGKPSKTTPKWKPPQPILKISKAKKGIVVSWDVNHPVSQHHNEVASYQIFAYQETPGPLTSDLWKKIGDVKALPLPMACTLTQFTAGYRYYFAVRGVDINERFGVFSDPGSILLDNDG